MVAISFEQAVVIVVIISDFDAHWTVVTPHGIRVNLWIFYLSGDGFAREPIVDAPPDIVGTGITPVSPPGVGGESVGVSGTKGVDKSRVNDICDTLTLFVGKARTFAVFFWPCQVNLGMRGV